MPFGIYCYRPILIILVSILIVFTIKAIFEFVQWTVFEIFEVKDQLWGNATLRNFNGTKICKKSDLFRPIPLFE
ncbi:hypothetical protein BLOT_014332 [Blomia tropicalis]|nr:hypothetical protein BLOT_014332 [Blomia tropicalis]